MSVRADLETQISAFRRARAVNAAVYAAAGDAAETAYEVLAALGDDEEHARSVIGRLLDDARSP